MSEDKTTEVAAKILKQIDYYFSDVNIVKDKFLKGELAKAGVEGWIKVDVLLTFNRLKALTTDKTVIKDAMRQSELCEVSENGEKIRRSPDHPLPTGVQLLSFDSKTLYIKGFPVELPFDDLLKWFHETGFQIDSVYRRKNRNGTPKPSVFVVLKSEEDAKRFLEEGPSKYNGKDFEERCFKQKWYEGKRSSRELQKQKQKEAMETAQKERREAIIAMKKRDIIPGSVLVVKGEFQSVTFQTMKDFFKNYHECLYVEFAEDKCSATLRFREENTAKAAWDAAVKDDKEEMENLKLEFVKILEGEEEKKFWDAQFAQRDERDRRAWEMRNKKGGGKNKRGGYKGKNDRRAGDNRKRPATWRDLDAVDVDQKQAKTDSANGVEAKPAATSSD